MLKYRRTPPPPPPPPPSFYNLVKTNGRTWAYSSKEWSHCKKSMINDFILRLKYFILTAIWYQPLWIRKRNTHGSPSPINAHLFCDILVKGQVASISSKSATTFFSDNWMSNNSKPTPFHPDWHSQYAHILRNHSRVGRKTAHSEADHRKNETFRSFLLVTAASLKFRQHAL